MILTPELLIQLAEAGASVEVRADGSFTMTAAAKMTAADKRAARNHRHYERLKASETVLKTSESSESSESDGVKAETLPPSPSLPLPPQTPLSPAHPHPPAPVPPPVREEAAVLSLDQPATKPAKNEGKGTQAELEAYAVEIGLPASDGAAMFDHWTANGWRNGSTPSKCWKAGMRKWKSQSWMPSQKAHRQNGFNGQRQPKHAAYNAETATLGLTGDQIGKF